MSRDTILVADDDPDFRELVRIVLEPHGLCVVQAEDGAEAVTIAERMRDRLLLVLLDYFMPAMSPVSCAAALRRFVREPAIVLCTASADVATRADELQLSRWLSKPFDLRELERLVEQARSES